jgi:hypothetical protein
MINVEWRMRKGACADGSRKLFYGEPGLVFKATAFAWRKEIVSNSVLSA